MREIIIGSIGAAAVILSLVVGFLTGRRTERRHAEEVWKARQGTNPYRVDDPDAEAEECL